MKHLRVESCYRCPFMTRGEVLHEGGTDTPMYRIASMFCTASENRLIVDSSARPEFCPLPIKVTHETNSMQ